MKHCITFHGMFFLQPLWKVWIFVLHSSVTHVQQISYWGPITIAVVDHTFYPCQGWRLSTMSKASYVHNLISQDPWWGG